MSKDYGYPTRCDHNKPIIGKLICSNGAIQIRAQCSICCSRGNAIPHSRFTADEIERMTILNEDPGFNIWERVG